jgi:hypothetical protein
MAEDFYNDEVSGYAISDIAHPPNDILIDDVVLNTMSDIDRIMAYHPVEEPIHYKYAAYLGFWWVRGKPFLCKQYTYPEQQKLDMRFRDLCTSLNEVFITRFILNAVLTKKTKDTCVNRDKGFDYKDLQDSLQYFLKYRHYTAQNLELFLKGLATCSLKR